MPFTHFFVQHPDVELPTLTEQTWQVNFPVAICGLHAHMRCSIDLWHSFCPPFEMTAHLLPYVNKVITHFSVCHYLADAVAMMDAQWL